MVDFVLVTFLCKCEVWLLSKVSEVPSNKVAYLNSEAVNDELFVCDNGFVVPVVFVIVIFGVSVLLSEM